MVMVPSFTRIAASTINPTTPKAAMTRWPVLRIESEVCVTIEAWAYFPIAESKRLSSCISALKYFTVS